MRGVARGGAGRGSGEAVDDVLDVADAAALGARGAIGAGRVTGWAPGGAWRAASVFAEPSRNSSDSFGISLAPIPKRSRQFRLSVSEPLVEF
jgi:hypothetical protein